MIKIGQIVRDERWTNTLWCLCNNYDEYLQFAKDLYLYKGLDIWGLRCENERWIEDKRDWYDLFDVDYERENEDTGECWDEDIDPINDTYEIKEKPNEDEYPVVVHYDNYHKNVLWMSLNKLKE